MAKRLYTNNAVGQVFNSTLLTTDTSVTLGAGEGAAFPSPTNGNWAVATLYKRNGVEESDHEVVHITARSGDVLTIERAKEGTTAKEFVQGDYFEVRMTAEEAQSFEDAARVATVTFTSDADRALTSDEHRYRTLVLSNGVTGGLTQGWSVTGFVEGAYDVINTTAEDHTLTTDGTGATTVIPAGAARRVYCDGAGVSEAPMSSSLTTLTVNPNSSGNVARRVSTTSGGGNGTEDGDGAWTKIATFTVGDANSTIAQLNLTFVGGQLATSTTRLQVTIKQGSSGLDTNQSRLVVHHAAPSSASSWAAFKEGSFRLVASAVAGSDIELWAKKHGDWGKWAVYEDSFQKEDPQFTSTYHSDAGWQSTAPTGDLVLDSSWAPANGNVSRKTATTLGTGGSNGNYWSKIATVTINAQYQAYDALWHFVSTNGGNDKAASILASVRIKQQAAFGSDPYIDLEVLSALDAFDASDLAAVVVDNSGPVVVDVYLREPRTYASSAIYEVSQIGKGEAEFLSGESYVSSIVASKTGTWASTGWTDLSLQNGWAIGTGGQSLRYRRSSDGWVIVEGYLDIGTYGQVNADPLPVRFRPGRLYRYSNATDDSATPGFARVYVDTNGAIACTNTSGTATKVAFNFSYPAEG